MIRMGCRWSCMSNYERNEHIRSDQKLFWNQSNWQAWCKNCHNRKTLTEDINPTYTY